MNVRDNLAAGKYENKVPHDVDIVPVDEDTMTVSQARAHQEAEKNRQREQRDKHRAEQGRLTALFRADLETEHGLVGHPRAAALWDKAWDRGHSHGYPEVIEVYEDLVELVA